MLKKSLLVVCTASLLSASTTMCYKKDHLDPSTIESVSLDGGECNGSLSVIDMKKDGYKIDSMKIQNTKDGLNYIYVFTKNSNKKETVAIPNSISDTHLSAQLKKIRKEEIIVKEKEEKISFVKAGEKLYLSNCVQCHGKKGEKEAYNTSKPLNTLSVEYMRRAILDYRLGDKDNGMAIVMNPYASFLTQDDIQKVYDYLHTVQ